MNINQSISLTFSTREIIAALRDAYPDTIQVQVMPRDAKGVTLSGNDAGVTMTFKRSPADRD